MSFAEPLSGKRGGLPMFYHPNLPLPSHFRKPFLNGGQLVGKPLELESAPQAPAEHGISNSEWKNYSTTGRHYVPFSHSPTLPAGPALGKD